jgi:hypothetical protein
MVGLLCLVWLIWPLATFSLHRGVWYAQKERKGIAWLGLAWLHFCLIDERFVDGRKENSRFDDEGYSRLRIELKLDGCALS